MKLFYHGSISKVDCPLVTIGRKNLDFGQGFYITPIREQAEKWARFVVCISNQTIIDNYLIFNNCIKLTRQ